VLNLNEKRTEQRQHKNSFVRFGRNVVWCGWFVSRFSSFIVNEPTHNTHHSFLHLQEIINHRLWNKSERDEWFCVSLSFIPLSFTLTFILHFIVMKGEERKEPHEPFTNLVTKGVLFMGWSLFMLSLIEMKRNTSEKRTRDSFSFNKNETEQTHDVGAASRGCVVCFSFLLA